MTFCPTLTQRNIPFVLAVGLLAPAGLAQDYRTPPEDIVRILETPRTPSVSVSPSGDHYLLIDQVNLPPLSDLAAPMLRLGGVRINPNTHGRHGARRYTGVRVVDLASGAERRVALPEDANISSPQWSPDGSQFAFTRTRDDGIELWVGSVETATARAVTPAHVNGIAGGFSWMPYGTSLMYRAVVENTTMPERSERSVGPIIQESGGGRSAPIRTYQDLLEDAHDEALFDYFFTSQPTIVDLATGEREKIGPAAIYSTFSRSPDGEYLLTSRIVRPYSYLVPYYSFAQEIEIRNKTGKLLRRVADKPIREHVPIGGVETGVRSIQWRPDRLHTLVWVEALDGGDPKREVPHRDRLMTQTVGGEGDVQEILRLETRYRGIAFLETTDLVLLDEYDRDTRWQRTWLTDLSEPDERRLVWDRSTQDRYADPGRPVTEPDPQGRSRVVVEQGRILLTGRGASPDGDRPFLRRLALDTLETEEVWRCQGEVYETVVDVLEQDGSRWITSRESRTDPPNYHLHVRGGSSRALTAFPDPFPELRKIRKERIHYERADGLPLTGTLYVPAGHQPGQRLPLIVWAYPREFNDPRTAAQVSGSQYRFTRLAGTSHLFLLTQGYAVLDGAAMPVVGPVETANDTFVEQIVAAAKAGIDKCVELGVADPQRVGVGGHSYGAFMTANLLAHSDLFRAGCARSGAYNRTLTPFGFQNERRTFWEAPMTYFAMSPFMHAPKVNEPILLIHGQIDNNSGTFPVQSERFYHAVKGAGGTVRLVMLPHESHGYRAKESVYHVLDEMVSWFDRHVKNAEISAPSGGKPQ